MDRTKSIAIPSSLRTIQPFLDESQAFMRRAGSTKSAALATKCKKMVVMCISKGFELNAILNMDMSDEDRDCLEKFREIRRTMVRDLGPELPDHSQPDYESTRGDEEIGTHEMLISEADTVMALGDLQLELGFREEAALNYHTSCVFYRVMETMVPSKATSKQHSNLLYAASRSRQCSQVFQNFVRESFTGGSCSDVYEVHGTSKLGKGSYGSVYLATHRITGDERAVKVMNVDRITSYYLRKLHTEISILKSLDHPNIIKLQDVFFGKRSVYIVTDLCRGGELFELLNSGKNQGFVFREDRASKLMKDMLSSVHYLHEHGIVHRDLKLENFLFEDHNSSSPLILIDFGLSKHFSPGEILTQKVGSCYYTAPEVLNGCYDYRCDVWSLGVLCYMLLTGSPPFYGKSVEDVYQAILTKEPSYTDKKFKHVSQGCMDFMKRLLTRDVRARMTTAEALQHPFITGATFFPRHQSMRADEFDLAKNAAQDAQSSLILTSDKTLSIMASMEVFVGANALTKLAMGLVAHSLSSADLQQFRDEFQAIDKSNSGTINLRDFLSFFEHVDPSIRKSFDARKLFNALRVESNFDGGETNSLVSYHEYIAAAMHNRVYIDTARLGMIFDFLDPERTARISAESINSALGDELPRDAITKMVMDGSPSGSGAATMNKDEYLKMWTNCWGEEEDDGDEEEVHAFDAKSDAKYHK